jgi:N-acetylglucosamine-6-phosphate deacetylase
MIVSGISVETGLGIEIEFDSHIRSIRPATVPVDAPWLAPAFIDVQVNGFAGVDYNCPTVSLDEVERSIHAIHSTGVARFLPTVITGPADEMAASLKNLAQSKNPAIAGFHVEGPHLSPEDGPRGAHPLASIRQPDLTEYHRWQEATDGRIRIVTVSPHWPQAPSYIEALACAGVTVSIGHTHANERQIADAVSAGASMSTHLGNAAHAVIKKQPNYLWEQIAEDRLTASFIVDGIHIQRAFLKTCLRAKGIDRCVLVTDASMPADAPVGRYYLGAQAVDYSADGRVVLAGTDRLAGSSLKMNDGVANLMRMVQLSRKEAVQMATENPGRMAKIPTGLRVGLPADMVLFRDDVKIEATYRDGVQVAH